MDRSAKITFALILFSFITLSIIALLFIGAMLS